jgi:hypothetical protein|tara:strand:- start:12 stop:260 length:249 start_codon:yes stop_codon:yes gene_type:complete
VKKFLALAVMIITIGIVDVVESQIATVGFLNNGKSYSVDVPLDRIPCKINEGDIIYSIKIKGVTVYKCIPGKKKKAKKKEKK